MSTPEKPASRNTLTFSQRYKLIEFLKPYLESHPNLSPSEAATAASSALGFSVSPLNVERLAGTPTPSEPEILITYTWRRLRTTRTSLSVTAQISTLTDILAYFVANSSLKAHNPELHARFLSLQSSLETPTERTP